MKLECEILNDEEKWSRTLTAKVPFTKELLDSTETFTMEDLYNAFLAQKKDEGFEVPEDMSTLIKRFVGHTPEVVLTQVKQQLPNSGKTDEFILAAINQIRG